MLYYKGHKQFGGVFSRDTLPTSCKKGQFYIINLNLHHEPGSHWVAVISFDRCYYFDSYGVFPPPEIVEFMEKREVVVNWYRVQALGSIMCGYFCIYIIDEMCRGRKFYDVLLDFDPNHYWENESKLMVYI